MKIRIDELRKIISEAVRRLTVQDDVLNSDAVLPQDVKIGRTTYNCEWYEVRFGSRTVVLDAPRWSGQTTVVPGDLWTDVRDRCRDWSRDHR